MTSNNNLNVEKNKAEVSKNVPELRFQGFIDAWELRKLSTEFEKVNERNDGSLGREHWISVAKMYFQSPEKVQSNNIDTRTYVMRIGDIAFEGHPNKDFKFGRFVANDIGTGVVSELFPIYRHKQDYNNYYWKNAIQIERIMGPIFSKSITSSGNSSNKLDPNHFLRQQIFIPKLEEQNKLGPFFKQLDNTITLHQRKLDKLKLLKKGYLQQIFPQYDEKVPRIRFANFEDEWEQRKLAKVFDTITDYVANGSFESLRNNVNLSDVNGFAYLVRLQDASNNWQGPWLYTDQHGYEFLKKSRLQPDDIIMANVGSVGKFFLVPKLDKPMTLAPNAVLIKSNENDQGFLYQMMLTPEMQYKIFEKTTPGVQSKINKTDFKMIETQLPNIEEQEKIGLFFKKLDHTIALHQSKLDKLKSLKQSLLQKMFI